MLALASRTPVSIRPLPVTQAKLKSRPMRRGAQVIQAVLNPAALNPQYGYVLGSVAITAGLLQYLAIEVGFARRKYGVKLPKMYADGDDEASAKFNCVQRVHQNAAENAPAVMALVILLGLQYPLYAASLGMIWNVSRIFYSKGYSSGDPAKRAPGFMVSFFAYVTLILSTLYSGLKLANVLPALPL